MLITLIFWFLGFAKDEHEDFTFLLYELGIFDELIFYRMLLSLVFSTLSGNC